MFNNTSVSATISYSHPENCVCEAAVPEPEEVSIELGGSKPDVVDAVKFVVCKYCGETLIRTVSLNA